jgi:hypothetical protein
MEGACTPLGMWGTELVNLEGPAGNWLETEIYCINVEYISFMSTCVCKQTIGNVSMKADPFEMNLCDYET